MVTMFSYRGIRITRIWRRKFLTCLKFSLAIRLLFVAHLAEEPGGLEWQNRNLIWLISPSL